ncbi:MAG: hypothetical protein ABJO09_12715 [Hyphomicrobiales bacterium]
MQGGKALKRCATIVLAASLGFAFLGYATAEIDQQAAPNTNNSDVSVYEQAQGLWLQCAEKQKSSTSESLESDYRLCNAVYNALGKAVSSKTYGGDDLKWLYFYMGRTSSSMALIALSVQDAGVSEPACASVERADWTFQQVNADQDSWEAGVIAQYELSSLVKTCRGKFGIPKWRQE